MTFVVRLVIKFRIWNWDDLTLGFSHVGGFVCLQAGFNLLIVYTLGPGNGAMDYDFHSLVKRARQELIHSFYKPRRNGESIYIYFFFSLPIPPLQANKDSNLLRWFSQVVYSLYLGSVYPSAPSSSLRDNYLPVIKRRYGLPAISA
jgi:hypothetical protein